MFGVRTAGVDISKSGIEWANRELAGGSHCFGNATNLSWVPSNSFNLVFSFAAIYHIPSAALQCKACSDVFCTATDALMLTLKIFIPLKALLKVLMICLD